MRVKCAPCDGYTPIMQYIVHRFLRLGTFFACSVTGLVIIRFESVCFAWNLCIGRSEIEPLFLSPIRFVDDWKPGSDVTLVLLVTSADFVEPVGEVAAGKLIYTFKIARYCRKSLSIIVKPLIERHPVFSKITLSNFCLCN